MERAAGGELVAAAVAEGGGDDGECCAVCLEGLGPRALRLPGCGHRLHAACALSNAQYDARCPVCRVVPEGVAERPSAERDGGGAEGGMLFVPWHEMREWVWGEDEEGDSEAEEEERRAWARYRARRQRALRRDPALAALHERARGLAREAQREGDLAERAHAAACRRAWREDPAVAAHRAARRRLQQRARARGARSAGGWSRSSAPSRAARRGTRRRPTTTTRTPARPEGGGGGTGWGRREEGGRRGGQQGGGRRGRRADARSRGTRGEGPRVRGEPKKEPAVRAYGRLAPASSRSRARIARQNSTRTIDCTRSTSRSKAALTPRRRGVGAVP